MQNENENIQIFKIPITGQRKTLTAQTIHDNEKLNIRMLENKNRLQIIDKKMINKRGKKMTMYELFDLAQTISNITKRKIDRLAKRNRNGLLCWLAESIDIISSKNSLEEIKEKLLENSRQNRQAQNDQSNASLGNSNQNLAQNNDNFENKNQNNNLRFDNFKPVLFINGDKDLSEEPPKIDIEDRELLRKQLFPDLPDEIVIPPLINHKKSDKAPQDLTSIYNLINS